MVFQQGRVNGRILRRFAPVAQGQSFQRRQPGIVPGMRPARQGLAVGRQVAAGIGAQGALTGRSQPGLHTAEPVLGKDGQAARLYLAGKQAADAAGAQVVHTVQGIVLHGGETGHVGQHGIGPRRGRAARARAFRAGAVDRRYAGEGQHAFKAGAGRIQGFGLRGTGKRHPDGRDGGIDVFPVAQQLAAIAAHKTQVRQAGLMDTPDHGAFDGGNGVHGGLLF
nr:MAG TPA_asm: hypothetical protein [Caudoviricetes sp.]